MTSSAGPATAGRVTQTTLHFERTGIGAGGAHAGFPEPGPKGGMLGRRAGDAALEEPPNEKLTLGYDDVAALAVDHGRGGDPHIRQELARLYTYSEVGRWNALRGRAEAQRGGGQSVASIGKLQQTRIVKLAARLGTEIVGTHGLLAGADGARGRCRGGGDGVLAGVVDLRRHRRDPAQHRRRARPRTPAATCARRSLPSRMEFNLFLPQMRLSFDDLVTRARTAEAAGFVGITGMDHLVPPLAEDQPMFEAMVTSTWLAAHTERLRIGSLVLCDAFRHPAVLAREAVSIDHASGGRYELGLGWGSVVEEFVTFGLGSTEPAARVARLRETLEVIRALWNGEVVDYDGEYHHLRAARQVPLPTSIPIVIGGVGRKTLALVREFADWWNVHTGHLDRIEELRAHAGDARVSVQQVVAVVHDERDRDEVTALGPTAVRVRQPGDRHGAGARRSLRPACPSAASSGPTPGSPTSPGPRPSTRSAGR